MKFLGRFEKNELEIYRPQIFSRKNIKNFKMGPSLPQNLLKTEIISQLGKIVFFEC